MNTLPALPPLRRRLGNTFFSLALLSYGAVLGGSLYQLIAEVPNWATPDVPRALIAYQNFFRVSHAGYFFQTLMPLALLSLGAATALLWPQAGPLRRGLLLLAGILLNELFTVAYFMPRNVVLFLTPLDDTPDVTINTFAREWQLANYLRLALSGLVMLSFLKAHRLLDAPPQPAPDAAPLPELRPTLTY
ncbi:DUF1772 domain-containing protein [Hymenobacter aquaticus]|uniref:DUF1772 domain-containing protein n=1 Tax=Hymenobacter aquaticus TaxID=1867101 RepID=A0A4Z0PXR7_9BACT|nr:DUF1772 domain-containing protein [Hymenobacter aquaticus]TGE21721.1 DUF1772 domain-containing protein [Hymenobacter aquaticus]